MRLECRQPMRSDVVTATTKQEYPYRDTIAEIERMGNCILDCTGHEFVRAVVGSFQSTTRPFPSSHSMLITLPCYVRTVVSFPLPRLFLSVMMVDYCHSSARNNAFSTPLQARTSHQSV